MQYICYIFILPFINNCSTLGMSSTVLIIFRGIDSKRSKHSSRDGLNDMFIEFEFGTAFRTKNGKFMNMLSLYSVIILFPF